MNISYLLFFLGLSGCESTPVEADDEGGLQGGSPTISVTPSQVTLVGVGDTARLQATASTASGETVPGSSLNWTSKDPAIATVTAEGFVTAADVGSTSIIVSYEGVADTAAIMVEAEEPPPPPPGNEEWDRVVADSTVEGDLVVPDGEKWLIGSSVEVAGNVRTAGGTIAMRPGSSLKFLGANPDEYVGGGMTYGPEFARDIGLWIGPEGVLDIRGTPKEAWNRTGTHPTWDADDEYWIAPTDADEREPRRWFPGDPIPQADPRVPRAEVINVTRDIVIEGPGHIHVHSGRPQRIEYVQLRRMGVSNAAFQGPVLGRYALHLHINGDGSRGTIIRGVAAVNSEGTVFVPHSSHGVTMTDNVSVNSFAEALWWDRHDHTNDLLVERLAVAGVHMPREVSGVTSRHDGATMGMGENMTIRNSAVAGVRGHKLSTGYDWPGATTSGPWEFEDNVAHNNEGPGIRFWLNTPDPHHPRRSILYDNGGVNHPGIETGAYRNSIRYTDIINLSGHLMHHSSSHEQSEDGGPARYERVVVEAPEGPAVIVGARKLEPLNYTEFIDCALEAGPGAPKVYIEDHRSDFNPWKAHFIRSGVTPDDFVFESLTGQNEGSHILIDHEDGRGWEILVQDGQKIVRDR